MPAIAVDESASSDLTVSDKPASSSDWRLTITLVIIITAAMAQKTRAAPSPIKTVRLLSIILSLMPETALACKHHGSISFITGLDYFEIPK